MVEEGEGGEGRGADEDTFFFSADGVGEDEPCGLVALVAAPEGCGPGEVEEGGCGGVAEGVECGEA